LAVARAKFEDGASRLVVIASAAKQSIYPLCRAMDCFARSQRRGEFGRVHRTTFAAPSRVPVVPRPEIFFTILVDGIFTTFIARLFTNTSDAVHANGATSCV
jgi:hypothetical protein